MADVMDFIARKQAIGTSFHQAAPLPSEANPAQYRVFLDCMGVQTIQDRRILCALVRDEIMAARREGRDEGALKPFLDWLEYSLASGE